jgi:hypothetical protein
LGLQTLQTLLVLAKDHARAPSGPAAYRQKLVRCGKVARVLVWIKLTKATPVEAVEQAKAPITLPVRTDRAIFGVPVATYLHRSSALRKHTKREVRRTIELPQSIGNMGNWAEKLSDTHLRLGVDRLFGIGHGVPRVTKISRTVTPFHVLLYATAAYSKRSFRAIW